MQRLDIPKNLDWQMWIDRWDKMQERYIAKRTKRFDIMVWLVDTTQSSVSRIVDLGCGTGSLMYEMLRAFPDAKACGVDFDPTLIPLARKRLESFGSRSEIIFADMRKEDWLEQITEPVDAIVSATALHWLNPEELSKLYGRLAKILRPGGIFLNADHAASENSKIQKAWQGQKEQAISQNKGETWENFWNDYMKALELKTTQICERVIDGWEGGVEDGMPLTWHFEKLKAAGFESTDCFWRYGCDAIYGAVMK